MRCSDFQVDSGGNIRCEISAHSDPYSVCSHGAKCFKVGREIGVGQTEFFGGFLYEKA